MSGEITTYNLKNLSQKLKISVKTLREYIKTGKLKAKKMGKVYYVTFGGRGFFFKD